MHADKWSPVASLFVALCLLEVEAALEVVRFLGLDFFLKVAVLVPFFAGFVGLVVWTLGYDRTYHRNPWPVRLTWIAAALVLGGFWTLAPLAWAGVALLAGAAVWNQVLVGRLNEQRRRAREVGRRLR